MKFKTDLNETLEIMRETYKNQMENTEQDDSFDDMDDSADKMFMLPKSFETLEN